MRKRFRIALVAAVVVFLAFVLWLFWPSNEPYYKGKPLSYWLRGYDYRYYAVWQGPMPSYLSSNSPAQADEAVQQLGTNAIPTLSRLLEATDSETHLRIRQFLLGSKSRGFCIRHGILAPFTRSWLGQQEAFKGLPILGSNAVGAVPSLIKLCNDDRSRDERIHAEEMLNQLGPAAKDAVPALIRIATTQYPRNRHDVESRLVACAALGMIHSHPELSVPALVRCLDDPEPAIKIMALAAIEHFGKDAYSAVPALVELVKSKNLDWSLKTTGLRVITKIDPETAAKLQTSH